MTQRLVGAALALLGLAIIFLSTQLPQPLAATRIQYGPGFFPLLLGAVIAVGGAALGLIKPSILDADEDSDQFHFRDFGKPLIVLLAGLAYVLFARDIGFLILAPVLLSGLLLLSGVRAVTAIALGIGVTIVVYFVFSKLLLVPLPLGLLTPWGGML